MMRWKRYLLVIPLVVACCYSSVSADETAPSQLPHVTPAMRTAGFWIAKHPSVDHVMMNDAQIKTFNENVRHQLKLTKDIFALTSSVPAETLTETFNKTIKEYTEKNYYLADGSRQDNTFVERMKKNMHVSAVILGAAPRYGLVTSFADQRFFPTKEGLFSKKGDLDFDELQNSGLDIGTPVAVLHTSLDGKWYYVFSALSDGWVEASKIALGDMAQVRAFAQAEKVVVMTAPKMDVYLDISMMSFSFPSRMGCKFPFLEDKEDRWIVQVPNKNKQGKLELIRGFISKAYAHVGYLPYSRRNIYQQAFLMLDKPYGWGDVNGEQDCSRFLQMIFATMGIELPRDSKNQAQVGKVLASFDQKTGNKEKLEALQKALGASTILPLKGHIMLYLGMVDGLPFAIHETSGYSKTKGDIQVKYVLNRVVVSDLSLGEDSAKGSLLRRLSKIVSIQ
jgi:hypothetical protein